MPGWHPLYLSLLIISAVLQMNATCRVASSNDHGRTMNRLVPDPNIRWRSDVVLDHAVKAVTSRQLRAAFGGSVGLGIPAYNCEVRKEI
jgi:hypothetical protein